MTTKVKDQLDILERMQKELHDLREQNDAAHKLKAANRGIADKEEKMEKMDNAIQALEIKFDKEFSKIELALKRASVGLSTPDEKQKELENKRFQRQVLSGKATLNEEAITKLYGHREDYDKIEKGMSVDDQAAGGFLVRPEFSDKVILKIYETSPVRMLADVKQISATSLVIPAIWDQVDAGWVGERQARSETDHADVSQIEIQAHEQYAKPQTTQILLDDSAFDVEGWLMKLIQDRFSRQEAEAFISGDGVARPRGIITYPSGTGFGQLQRVNSGHATEFTANGLIDLQDALFEVYQPNARFLVRRAGANQIRKLVDTQNRYLFSIDTGRIVQGMRPFMLLDKPLEYADHLPSPAAGTLSAIYGDFMAGYCVVDRVGIRMLRDPYSNKPNIEFYTTRRVGGGVVNFDALKIQRIGT